ncbi:MAPEG family protein [Profundibacter sp.]
MIITITPLYAGLIALLFVTLSFRVISLRRSDRISLGDESRTDMAYRIRAHGNCAEYAPMGLILLAMAEMQGAPVWVLHLLGLMLLIGRVMHGWALCQTPQNLPIRVYGMMLTLMMITFAAIANIGHALL